MAKVEITMLGGFEIRVNGRPVLAQLAQSRKATALVQFLILQRCERVPHKVLTNTLWNGERATNPDMALRAILHRFRNMVEEEDLPELDNCIVTSRGYYQWNPHLDCEVDVFCVEDLAAAARREGDPDRRGRLQEQLVARYTGRLLPTVAAEPWVESRSVRLHAVYRAALLELLDLCKRWNEMSRIVALCEQALAMDPYEERLYLEQIMALEALGRREEAQEVTQRGLAMGCLHRDVVPEQVGTAWRMVRQADLAKEGDMERLVASMPAEGSGGAAICSFEEFRQMYQVQRGIQSRYGVPVFLAMVTIVPENAAAAEEIDAVVRELAEIIRTSLRQCDAAARYSELQFAILLCGTTAENGRTPLERIKANFYAGQTKGKYLLSYTLHAPEAKKTSPRNRRRKAAVD